MEQLSDDGWSGTRWDSPGMSKLLDEVDKGTVSAVLCKDMSRAGRDFLRVELLMETLREKGVRFIAINDNVDREIKPCLVYVLHHQGHVLTALFD